MRTPDPNSVDYRFIEALLGTYIPKSKMTKEQSEAYYRMMKFTVSESKSKRDEFLKRVKDAGIMCEALDSIIKDIFPKTYSKNK